MSEKRFSNLEIVKNLIMLDDNDKFTVFTEKTLCNLLNSLVDENKQLRQSIDHMIEKATEISNRNVLLHEEIGRLTRKLREKEEDERLYANEIVKLNKEAKEVLNFKTLGGDY